MYILFPCALVNFLDKSEAPDQLMFVLSNDSFATYSVSPHIHVYFLECIISSVIDSFRKPQELVAQPPCSSSSFRSILYVVWTRIIPDQAYSRPGQSVKSGEFD
jgi:hypothetical protein